MHRGHALEQVFRQRQYVGGPLAQGGHADGQHAQAKIQLLPEAARRDRAPQIGVGDGDQARRDRQRFGAAQPLESALFEDAQQLRLRGRRKRRHLIQQDGALAGHFQPAQFALDRSGKSASFVAEQLGLDKLLGQAGAIDLQVGSIAPLAQLVNQARVVVLAGAAFAGDQHGCGGIGNLARQLQHVRRSRIGGYPVDADVAHVSRPPAAEASPSRLGKVETARLPPQPLEIVELPQALAEDVHDETSVVEQLPFRSRTPFAVRGTHAVSVQGLLDAVADGSHLRRAESGAHQKVIGEGSEAGQIEQGHASGFLALRGLDGPAQFGAKVFGGHRYRACLIMYSSTRGGTSPRMLRPRSSRRRTSVAETLLSTLSSKKTVLCSSAMARGSGRCGGWRRQELRRDHLPQRVGAEAGPAGDDEVAQVEQRVVILPGPQVQERVRAEDKVEMVARLVEFLAKQAHGIDGITDSRPVAIPAGFGERGHEVRMAGAGQRNHPEAMLERRQVGRGFMRRVTHGNEIYLVEMKAPLRGACDGQVTQMDRIESAAEKSDAPALGRSAPLAFGSLCAQRSSVSGAAPAACSVSSATGGAGASRSSASAMARTRAVMPSPVAEEMAWNSSPREAQ